MNTSNKRGPGNCGPFSASVKMHHMMNKKISEAIEFASRASIYKAEVTATELTTAQSILLSIMYSLLQNDMGFCVSLLELAQSVDQLRSSYLPMWLKDDFNFQDEQVIQVISRLALLASSSILIIPSYIEKVFAGLALKYKVVQWCKTSGNTSVMHFLSNFGFSGLVDNAQCQLNLLSKPAFVIPNQAINSYKNSAINRMPELGVECSDPASAHVTSTTSASTSPTTAISSSSIQGASSNEPYISSLKKYLKVPDDFLEEDVMSLISYSDADGNTPLHNAVEEGNPFVVECMLVLGAKVDAANAIGYTPSHCAASRGSIPMLQVLIQHQANLSLARHDGCIPLHEAIINGHVDAGKWLLNHGTDINARNEDGWSPLHLAAQWDQLEMVRLLIANGADIDVYNNNGMRAIDVAREEGNMSIIQLLSEKTGT